MAESVKSLISNRLLDVSLRQLLLGSPIWTRLEPQSVSGDPAPGLDARVHDPLWMLGRQWQLAEFEGEDAGTPVTVQIKARSTPLTAWRPGDRDAGLPARALDPIQPLDALVERETAPGAPVGLKARAQTGAHLIECLQEAGFDARAALVAACPLLSGENAAFERPGAPPEHTMAPPWVSVVAGTVPDGIAAAEQLRAGNAPWLDGADEPARAAAAEWLAWVSDLYPAAAPEEAWMPGRFEYRFAVAAGAGDSQVVLEAPLHEGGVIDWYTFDADPAARLAPAEPAPAGGARALDVNVIAAPLRFPGMPADRYWQFEDGQVNLARLETQPHEPARLCFTEFAMIYSNDWLMVPLTLETGTFTVIDEISYTTTFGDRIVVPRADDAQRAGRFRLFAFSRAGSPAETVPGLLLPPTALSAMHGPPLEEVTFLRDEMANLVWAVEGVVQARSGESRSRRDEAMPVNAPDADRLPEAEGQYLLATEVPRHWIPFVPVATGVGSIKLRKGTMVADQDLSLGTLLREQPLDVFDEEVPREGLRVTRMPILARGSDGRYVKWITRRAQAGRGEGCSGLAFDGVYR